MFSPLCEYCQSIIFTNDSLIHSHYANASALDASAAHGCSLCIIVRDALQHTPWPTSRGYGVDETKFYFYVSNGHFATGRFPTTIFFAVEFLEGGVYRALEGKRGRKERFEVSVPIRVVPIASSNAVSPQPDSSQSTNSKESWITAHRWLDICKTHTKCHKNNVPWRLPSRLLDVGTNSNPTLRLHVTDNHVSTVSYITLSHCWGTGNPEQKKYLLLKNRLEQMRERIDIATLPKTFNDAIDITRRLGIRYLWIDSMCIIQQDTEDWARESSMMGSVYQNGFCNIAATAAKDGSIGCFQSRNPALAQPCRVNIEKRLSEFGLSKGIYDLIPQVWEKLSTEPLLKRAWVVQERLLAPRVLHFARNQLFWECGELDACEMYPTGAPSSFDQSNRIGDGHYRFWNTQLKSRDASLIRSEIKIATGLAPFRSSPKLPSGSHVDQYYVWNKIVTAFTKCGITYDTDRLMAIAAIASDTQATTGDEYLAGLWKKHLPYHLLWGINDRFSPQVTNKGNYVAPSWSWASQEQAIDPYVYLRPNNPPLIRILSAGTVPINPDHPMGQVKGGHIKLRGWLRKFHVMIPAPQWELFTCHTVSESADFDDFIGQPPERDVWFLAVISLNPWVEFEMLGLLLEETAAGDFKRVGRFHATGDVAKRFFRKPLRPLGSEIDPSGSDQNSEAPLLGNGKERGCFQSLCKKKDADPEKRWRERVIVII